jgi:hypothetical protein
MADDTPTPPSIDARTRWQRVRAWLLPILAVLLPVVSSVAVREGCPKVAEVVREVEVLVPVAAPALDEFSPTMGWQRDEQVIAENLDPAKTLHFDQTDAGRTVQGDEDVFLWQAVRKVTGKAPPYYPNINQQSVGCCVGCGWKHSADVCQAFQIVRGVRAEWKPLSAEVIYGESRVDVGGGRISGDGSNGSWAAKAAQVYGMAPMEKIGSTDLTTFSPSRARQFGKSGVPAEVKAVAKQHPVKGCALVKSWTDVKRAVQQGYPVAVCSNVGFRMERDATGRCRPQGNWNHCMAILAVRAGDNEGGFILNSWGDNAHTGPVWPADMPVAGFWADASVIDRMVRQGDSFALSDLQGFAARKLPLNWDVRAEPRRDTGIARLFPIQYDRPLAW